jgi:chitin synthase
VYDISKFYKAQHSDIVGADVTSDDMLTLAGRDLTPYFPVPLILGCGDFVTNDKVYLQNANFTPEVPTAFHYSGEQQSVQTSALRQDDWYTARFLPKMKQYYKGPMVYTKGQLQKGADDDKRVWAMYNKRVYDISDYIYTIDTMNDDRTYRFLPSALTDIFEQQPGTDITQAVDDLDERSLNSTLKAQALFCLDNVFYRGEFDFRVTPRCTVQSYFLLAFSIILITTIAAKFVAALQITKKRNPELQDKFVICQVPCYTEGEESLKKTIDSLANLKYDDKRKLLFVIFDGMIVGSGNDRPTPRIVLDILGVENLDPDPLLFKSLGQGNRQLNYVSTRLSAPLQDTYESIDHRAKYTPACMNLKDMSCLISWS